MQRAVWPGSSLSVWVRQAAEEVEDPFGQRGAAEPQHQFIQVYLAQRPTLRQRDPQPPAPRLGFIPLVPNREAQRHKERQKSETKNQKRKGEITLVEVSWL